MYISSSTVSTFQKYYFFIRIVKVKQKSVCFKISYHSTYRYFNYKVISRFPCGTCRSSFFSVSRLKFLTAFKIYQCIYIRVCNKNYISAFSPVSAVRSSELYKFLPPESSGTISAFSRYNSDYTFIYKHFFSYFTL